MFKIGVVDDREEQRETFSNAVKIQLRYLNEDIEVLDIFPFYHKEEYITWIQENNISVLILDEKLHETTKNGQAVKYDGHELGIYLNRHLKNFPLFVVTSYDGVIELEKNLKEFFLILARTEFHDNAKQYTNLFLNSGRKFYKDFHLELSELTRIAKKIAVGQASDEEINEVKVIQEKLQIPSTVYLLNDRSTSIGELSIHLDKLNSLNNEIKIFLRNNKL